MAAAPRIDELRKRYDENPRRFFAPLANEYRKSGDLEQAIALCRMHLADAPTNLSGQIVFGQALYDAGAHDEARAAFETAIGLDPENLIALRHLGDIARLQEDVPRAREWYQRVLDADRRNEDVLALMAELAAIDAAQTAQPASARAPEHQFGDAAAAPADLIDMEAPPPEPVRATATKSSMASLIGLESTTIETAAIPTPAEVHEEAASAAPIDFGFEPTSVDLDPTIETAAIEPPLDFGMVDAPPPAPAEPTAPPESSFGLEIDLGTPAAMSAVSDGPAAPMPEFGVVELSDTTLDAPFDLGSDSVAPAETTEIGQPPVADFGLALADAMTALETQDEPLDIEHAFEMPGAVEPSVSQQVEPDAAPALAAPAEDALDFDMDIEPAEPVAAVVEAAVEPTVEPAVEPVVEPVVEPLVEPTVEQAPEPLPRLSRATPPVMRVIEPEPEGEEFLPLELEDVSPARNTPPPMPIISPAFSEPAAVTAYDPTPIIAATPIVAATPIASATPVSSATPIASATPIEVPAVIDTPVASDEPSVVELAIDSPSVSEPVAVDEPPVSVASTPPFDSPLPDWDAPPEQGAEPDQAAGLDQVVEMDQAAELDYTAELDQAHEVDLAPETGPPSLPAPSLDETPIHSATPIEPAQPVQAFATETMAELYVRQGLRHEAIAVYRQLVDARPDDSALRTRLAELEHGPQQVTGGSARSFFAGLSGRGAVARPGTPIPIAVAPTSPPAGTAAVEPDTGPRKPSDALGELLGNSTVSTADADAAESLSSAFGGPADPAHLQSGEFLLDQSFNFPPVRKTPEDRGRDRS